MDQDRHYATLEKFSLFNNYFAYMDTEGNLADGLFIKHKVRVYFGDEFEKPGSRYKIILCHVRKRDTDRFLAAIEELPNKMLLCGYTDYLDYCLSTWAKIKEKKNEGRESCEANGVAQQA